MSSRLYEAAEARLCASQACFVGVDVAPIGYYFEPDIYYRFYEPISDTSSVPLPAADVDK